MIKKRTPLLSVIAPAFNEEENIIPLIEAFDALRKKVRYEIELIIVDDGSTDKTADRVRSMKKPYPFVKLVSYSGNMGKTFAVQRGFDAAVGQYIVIFDADLQFDPNDIPQMVEKLNRGADLVAGYKVGKYQKPLVSKIYNKLGNILFRIPVRDMNAMKAMRRKVLEVIPFRPDWHRYIVIWAHKSGFKLTEHPVKLRPRKRGKSKYRGIGRILIGMFDMVSVWFQLTFARRPMLFFGTAGIFTFALAFLIGIVAIVLRYGYGIGFRPLLTLIAMLANIGVILFIGGFLGEMIEGLRDKINQIGKPSPLLRRTDSEQKRRKKSSNNYEKSENKKKRSEREQNKSNHSLNLEHSKNVETNTAPLEPVSPENNDAQKTLESSDEKEKTTTSQASWGRKKRRGKKRL